MLNTQTECIEYIHSAGRFGKKAGLENIKALLSALGNPQNKLKFIHVAGTNGKGSVTCMLSNILKEAGCKVGMNTSPYIEEFNERLQINNIPIDGEKLVRYTNIVAKEVEKLNKNGICPIEFEIITAIGFLYFKDEKCDYVVLECGLGGRFDATNVIKKPEVSVICSIGLDHTEILGETIEKIAFEKAGIIKPYCPVVVYSDNEKTAIDVIEQKAEKCMSPFYLSDSSFEVNSRTLDKTIFSLDGEEYELSLLGDHQIKNAALAIRTAQVMGISPKNIKDGISNARWKCRFEKIKDSFIIDGAHNFDGVLSFVQSVKDYMDSAENIFIIGMLNDKNFEESAKKLSELKGRIIVTDVPSYRQTNGIEVFESIKKYSPNALYIKDYKEALDMAVSLKRKKGYVCIAGSLYLAGAMRTEINFYKN